MGTPNQFIFIFIDCFKNFKHLIIKNRFNQLVQYGKRFSAL